MPPPDRLIVPVWLWMSPEFSILEEMVATPVPEERKIVPALSNVRPEMLTELARMWKNAPGKLFQRTLAAPPRPRPPPSMVVVCVLLNVRSRNLLLLLRVYFCQGHQKCVIFVIYNRRHGGVGGDADTGKRALYRRKRSYSNSGVLHDISSLP